MLKRILILLLASVFVFYYYTQAKQENGSGNYSYQIVSEIQALSDSSYAQFHIDSSHRSQIFLNENKTFAFIGFKQEKIDNIIWRKDNDSIVVYEFYSTGSIKMRFSTFENNMLNDEVAFFYENGNLKQIGHLQKGKRLYGWKTFYMNGLLKNYEYFIRPDKKASKRKIWKILFRKLTEKL